MIVMGKMKIKLKGRLAWYMHRGYHGLAMPTWNRKIRVIADWTLTCSSSARSSRSVPWRPRARSSTRPPSRRRPRPPAEARVEEKAKAS